jgi:hypothetical protein
MATTHDQLVKLVAKGIAEVAAAFADEIERNPSTVELLELLLWGVRAGDKEKFSDVQVSNLVALRPQFGTGSKPRDSAAVAEGISAVAELNDAAFVAARDFIRELVDAMSSATERLPTLRKVCDLLVAGLRECGDAVSDAGQVVGIKAEIRKTKKVKPAIGDIVAIPATNGECHIAVILAKNAFGTAFGLFKGTRKPRPILKDPPPSVLLPPLYSDDRQIESGRWPIIGHDDSLRELFPADPEIFHRQHTDQPNPALGPHGAGETAAGKLRPLTKDEAEKVGLLRDDFRQTYASETMEQYLNATLR